MVLTMNAFVQCGLYCGVLLLAAKLLGRFMADVYEGRNRRSTCVLGPVERLVYRMCGVDSSHEMRWTEYAAAALVFNLVGMLALYVLQRFQPFLPLNPRHMGMIEPTLAFNTAVSFTTNTNWQAYGGETTLGHLVQMLGLGVQNFLSAATGMAVMVALARGIMRCNSDVVGNFWQDMVRSVIYVLLPLSLVVGVALVSQGVVQNLDGSRQVRLLEPVCDADGRTVAMQELAQGPVASQVAIKQLGTNGGGFFNVNSAHPYENPTPLSNFIECLCILLIPAAMCCMFGTMVRDTRQGWTLWWVMLVLFVVFLGACGYFEQRGTPVLARLGIDLHPSLLHPGGNMEGKETRFGIVGSALWATATTAASSGSVNAMHDSFTPLGGLVPLVLMQLGEVVFGGVGSGLYGMILMVVLTVFICGLMVGRTPEYLGKKIEAFEMKMATIGVLVPIVAVLIGTALALATPSTRGLLGNHGPHGFSEVLYAFSSAGNNNGSAFAGLNANTPFMNVATGLAMLAGRYWVMVPVLAIAGALGRKGFTPPSAGTLPTHGVQFALVLISVVLIISALSFLPALALGPIVEQLMMGSP